MRIGNKDLHCSLCLLSGVLAQTYLCLGKTGQIFDHIETVLRKCPKIHLNPSKDNFAPPKNPSNKQTKQNHNLLPKTRWKFRKRNVKSRTSYLQLGAIFALRWTPERAESQPPQLHPEHSRLRLVWSAPCNCVDAELQEELTTQEPFHRSSIWCEITAPASMLWIWVFTPNFRQLFSVRFFIMNDCTKN